MLLAAPNVSEGRDHGTLEAIGRAFTASGRARLLDLHADPDHHRSVYTLAGEPGALARALADGARAVIGSVDINTPRGIHPYVGALDVVPLIHLDRATRGEACAAALVVADLIARELEIPVFLYGALAQGRTRAELRRGGPQELARRLAARELQPDFGPPRLHPTAGATLVAARPPLVAFNVELAPPASEQTAQDIAARIRDGGPEGLTGVRAIGLTLARKAGVAQVSTNVEDPLATPLAAIVAAIARHATPAQAEIVGLAPRAALSGFPADLPIAGFDPARHVLENALTV